MARYDTNWKIGALLLIVLVIFTELAVDGVAGSKDLLTACQHLRRSESRRSRSLGDQGSKTVRIPRCTEAGAFEPVQCSNDINNTECWCVDEYGVEIVGTRRDREDDVNCAAVGNRCSASSCRMYCPAGFARDARSGCPVCQCRDPCEGITCPGSLSCHPQEVQCSTEPCPPVPTCKRARSLAEMCPVGQPLSISGTIRPFLCGTDPGKPTCPPLYKCLVQLGNDYGVCCPASLKYEKPGQCPGVEHQEFSPAAGLICGIPCGHDLECPQLQKCCQTNGCGTNCQQPFNVTACHQARMLSELLSVNEREGKGYIPQCDGPGGLFSSKQCSRNGLVCWCVDTKSGHKIKGTMGVATLVDCEGAENLIARSSGRSVDAPQGCDHNICAAVCEYGFKNDHNGCPTCECSEPCEGYRCPMGSHCEVAKDPECISGSSLCASEPICKPDLAYSNPCDEGTPLADNVTGEVFFCRMDSINTEDFQTQSFFDAAPEETFGRAMTNFIACPRDYQCTKLHKEANNVCCPQTLQASATKHEIQIDRQQTMCEYLRDFADRMEGTEDGMVMALSSPRCDKDGMYLPRQCAAKRIKVTLAEQKRLLEERNVRQMKMLLSRPRRNSPIDEVKVVNMDQATESLRALQDLNIRNLVDFLRQKILNPATHPEELYFAEMILNNQDMGLEGRTAKVIDFSQPKSQSVADEKNLFSFEKPKRKPTPPVENQMVEMELEECWCVDGFGTEIPRTKALNTTQEECENLRETLECLDLTCRMGCEYGFILDSDSRCPSCQCRDPCDNIQCPEHQECRTVDVSCDGEYCPPVPACLPRKPGQCPFLVPPGNDDACEYECRSDSHCDGTKRCCSNGCGTQCVEPQLKTACQHLQSIQLHQSIELGVPARQKYIAQCDERNGSWKAVQCGPDGTCWCVDNLGNERSGTRVNNSQPNCDGEPITECPLYKCAGSCEHGNVLDSNGCSTCECRDPCSEISCPNGEKCNLVQVECIDTPCPRMPICVPFMDSVCIEGEPLRQNGQEMTCGPQSAGESCPSTHVCQINPLNNKGVCCGKQRDVCFESLEPGCLDTDKDENNSSHVHRWTFNTRLNKCVSIKSTTPCQSKNLFHNENACKAVCPALTQCERLRLKNSLAARRTGGQTLSWFQPRCDPDTGSWSPVQCLGKPVSREEPKGRAFRVDVPSQDDLGIGVCWCADKKGAPLRGSLTRNNEPICNHRQARRRMNDDELQDPVMEELIRQMTILVEDNLVEDEAQEITTESLLKHISTTLALNDRVLHKSTTSNPRQERLSSTRHLVASSTRCEALKQSAPFPVACDSEGGFAPMQCNGEICWCVDAAGNQLPMSSTFKLGTKQCVYTPIDLVAIELHLNNPERRMYNNVYEILRDELSQLLGDTPDNLRVHENTDGSIMVKFDLTGLRKIDEAFAIEEMVKQSNLLLVGGELRPDITLSRFLHRNSNLPVPQPASGIPETTFQTIVFIMATASAFLVSVFVIFVMLKRGRNKNKQFHGDKYTMGDKYLDYGSPIFVLAAKEQQDANKFMSK